MFQKMFSALGCLESPEEKESENAVASSYNPSSWHDSNIGAVYRELLCAGCGSLCIMPSLLPCDDTVCDTCLQQMKNEVRSHGKGSISVRCPKCRSDFYFSPQTEIRFPENFLLKSILEKYINQIEAPGEHGQTVLKKPKVFCQLCDQKASSSEVTRCITCNLNYCENCLQTIHGNRAFLSHILAMPFNLTESDMKCFLHPDFEIIQYCSRDRQLLCDQCKKTTHLDHPVSTLNDAIINESKKLHAVVSEFRKAKAKYEQSILQVNEIKASLDDTETEFNQQLFKDFLSLHEALQHKEEQIHELIKKEKRKKQADIDHFTTLASELIHKMEGLDSFVSEAFQEANPIIFLQICRVIENRLKQLTVDLIEPNNSLKINPLQDFHLDVSPVRSAIKNIHVKTCEGMLPAVCAEDMQDTHGYQRPHYDSKMVPSSLKFDSAHPRDSSPQGAHKVNKSTSTHDLGKTNRQQDIQTDLPKIKTQTSESSTANSKATESPKSQANSKAEESTKIQANSKATESQKIQANSKATEFPKTQANSKATESTKIQANSKATESQKIQANSKAMESPKTQANSKATEFPKIQANSKATESKKTLANSKATESSKIQANSKATESSKMQANSKATESQKIQANSKAMESPKTQTNSKATEFPKIQGNSKATESKKTLANSKATESSKIQANSKATESPNTQVKPIELVTVIGKTVLYSHIDTPSVSKPKVSSSAQSNLSKLTEISLPVMGAAEKGIHRSSSTLFVNRATGDAIMQHRPKSLPLILAPPLTSLNIKYKNSKGQDKNAGQESSRSGSSIIFTTETVPSSEMKLPNPPTITEHTADGSSAKIIWTHPEEPVDYHEVQLQEIISTDKTHSIPGDKSGLFSGIKHDFFTVVDLNSNTEYLFRVRSVSSAGPGSWSEPYRLSTVGVKEEGNSIPDESSDLTSVRAVRVTVRRHSAVVIGKSKPLL